MHQHGWSVHQNKKEVVRKKLGKKWRRRRRWKNNWRKNKEKLRKARRWERQTSCPWYDQEEPLKNTKKDVSTNTWNQSWSWRTTARCSQHHRDSQWGPSMFSRYYWQSEPQLRTELPETRRPSVQLSFMESRISPASFGGTLGPVMASLTRSPALLFIHMMFEKFQHFQNPWLCHDFPRTLVFCLYGAAQWLGVQRGRTFTEPVDHPMFLLVSELRIYTFHGTS